MATSGAEAAAGGGAEVTIRAARREDMARVHAMIHELAAFENVPDGPKLSVQDLITDGFECSPPWFSVVVAETGGAVVGYALVNRAYSSWTRRALYIEDLYVEPRQRGAGVGMKLVRALCEMALEEDIHRIDWHVLEENLGGRRFYARLGARDLHQTEGRLMLRLDRHRIEAVATQQL
ncbi:thialysine N-epsilon-acetyltransferase isoform X2 [Amyelois transitella]|uniref:thialysine N-epsilon-acetyltransferase isoform X2 n=1 Tax=Amyelois transitella TaxID=680683 RepID=UPI00067C4297|nr:thialysine N-epsilon-acetyltransferase isoform X2 [Amyelois transitella]